MKKPIIVFISGLGATGKSSCVKYFHMHPVQGFSFFDFDKGPYKIPPHQESHLEWRTKTNDYWLERAFKEFKKNGSHSVIIGLCLYPRQIKALISTKYFNKADLYFALLVCHPDERMKRLYERGTSHHWQGHKPWYDEFCSEMKSVDPYIIDTTHIPTETVAQKISEWLMDL